MNKYVISVIVPCYNVEKYIARCLNSLVNQDIEEKYEIIVVDDGTKDDSAVIAQDYADQYPEKVRVLHKTNGGLSSARNYGIDHSDSEYLSFVDSDDYVSPNFLRTLYGISKRDNADISMCGVIRTTDSSFSGKRFNTGYSCDFSTTDVMSVIYNSSYAAWNKLYKRELFKNVRYPEGVNYEDLATTPLLMYASKIISYTDEPLLFYYQNEDSITLSQKSITKRYDLVKSVTLLENSILKNEEDLLEKIYIDKILFSFLWCAFMPKIENSVLIEIFEHTNKKYPFICQNKVIKRRPLYMKLFLICFMKKKWNICWSIVNVYEGVFKIYSSTINVLKKIK